MKTIRSITELAGFICFGWIYYYFLFQYQFAYNFMPEITLHYGLFSVCTTVFVIFSFVQFFDAKSIQVSWLDLGALLLLLHMLISIAHDDQKLNLANEKFICYVIMLQLYFLVRCCCRNVISFAIPILLMFFFFSELIIGTKQICLYFSAPDRALLIRGSLQNSGIYSLFLLLNLPFYHYLLLRSELPKFLIVALFSIVIFFVATVLYITMSRTACVMLLVYLFFLAIKYVIKNSHASMFFQKHRWKMYALVVALSILVTASLLLFKPGSAQGRLFVWKVTLAHIAEHPLAGTGIGCFAVDYPQWQIQYVSDHPHLPEKYLLNADETHVAMNEFLELFIECGVFFFLGFLLLVVFLLRKKNALYQQLAVCAKSTVILVMVAALFSYPLHANPITAIFVFCIAMMAGTGSGTSISLAKNRPVKIVFALLMIPACVVARIAYKQSIITDKWSKITDNVFASSQEAAVGYTVLYPLLKTDGKFMLNYGECLLRNKQPVEAVKILEASKEYYFSYRTLLSTADACYQAKNFQGAIANLVELANLVPYKFYPKYLLAKLYYETGNLNQAKATAHQMLSMPVKVSSPEILSMKQEIQKLTTE